MSTDATKINFLGDEEYNVFCIKGKYLGVPVQKFQMHSLTFKYAQCVPRRFPPVPRFPIRSPSKDDITVETLDHDGRRNSSSTPPFSFFIHFLRPKIRFLYDPKYFTNPKIESFYRYTSLFLKHTYQVFINRGRCSRLYFGIKGRLPLFWT